MTARETRAYYLFCDECPSDEYDTSETATNLEEAQRLAINHGWTLEFEGSGISYDVCPKCVKRRHQRACADSPSGHTWRRQWFSGQADDDGWAWMDLGAASHWKRFCLNCQYSEHAGGPHGGTEVLRDQ